MSTPPENENAPLQLSARERGLNESFQKFSRGDPSAYDEIYRSAWPILVRHCMRLLVHQQDAEDAAQGALLRVLTRIGEFDGRMAGLPWVLGIARYEALTLRGKRVRRRESALCDVSPDARADPEVLVMEGERIEALRRASLLLNETDRILLASGVRERDEGPSDPCVRKRRQRARERLHRRWREALSIPHSPMSNNALLGG